MPVQGRVHVALQQNHLHKLHHSRTSQAPTEEQQQHQNSQSGMQEHHKPNWSMLSTVKPTARRSYISNMLWFHMSTGYEIADHNSFVVSLLLASPLILPAAHAATTDYVGHQK